MLFLNSMAYPYDNLNLDFTKNNFILLYDIPSTFLSNALIVVIDTSKQNDSATASSVDAQLEIEASESLKGVTPYCLLIHDRIVEYVPFTREVRKLVNSCVQMFISGLQMCTNEITIVVQH
ncbi:Uncharacterized protein FWK35_00017960, partial [Aphis craccivora]